MSEGKDTEMMFDAEVAEEQNRRVKGEPEMETQPEVKIQFPSNTIICAAPKSGKSSMILSIIDGAEFDHIFVVSGTPENSNFADIADVVLPTVSEKFLQDLISCHEEQCLKTLLIWDDFIGTESSGFNVKNSPAVNRIASSGRHKNISTIFSSQDWTSIPITVRRMANYYFLGENNFDVNKNLSKILANGSMPPKKLFGELSDISSKHTFEFIMYDRLDKKSWHKLMPSIRSGN